MTSLPRIALGELIEILSGFAFPSTGFNDTEGLPIARIRDVVRGFSETRYKGGYDSQFLISDGDILIGMDGEFNTARWRGGRALLNQRVCRVRAISSRLDESYLFRFLPGALKKIEDATPFLTVKHLSAKQLKHVKIPVPPLAEQKRIAAIFDATQALREKRRQALAKLDSLTQSVFFETFGDPVRNTNGFGIRKLRSAIELRGGFAFKSTDYVANGIPLVRIGEVNRGSFNFNDLCFLPAEMESTHKRFVIGPGSLLMGLTGTTGKDDYANVFILGHTFDKYFLNQRVALILPNPSCFDRTYLLYVLRNAGIKRQLTSRSRGIRQANIGNSDILELRIPAPPIALQRKFAQRNAVIGELKAKCEHSLRQFDALFVSLHQRAFRGDL